MHPFGLYLAITDRQREEHHVAAEEQRVTFARVDALPISNPEPVSRVSRVAAIVRRRVLRTAGA
jgi:hypothetical protein